MSLVNGKRQAAWFTDGAGAGGEGAFAGVVFNRPVDQVFTYGVPPRLASSLRVGQRVRVPLGKGNKLAVVDCVQLMTELPAEGDPARVKDVLDALHKAGFNAAVK